MSLGWSGVMMMTLTVKELKAELDHYFDDQEVRLFDRPERGSYHEYTIDTGAWVSCDDVVYIGEVQRLGCLSEDVSKELEYH